LTGVCWANWIEGANTNGNRGELSACRICSRSQDCQVLLVVNMLRFFEERYLIQELMLQDRHIPNAVEYTQLAGHSTCDTLTYSFCLLSNQFLSYTRTFFLGTFSFYYCCFSVHRCFITFYSHVCCIPGGRLHRKTKNNG